MVSTYVDLEEHELCRPLSAIGRLYERSSSLPCCFSINCLLRHDPRLSAFSLPQESNPVGQTSEELLILDSAYDFVALMPLSGLGPTTGGRIVMVKGGDDEEDPSFAEVTRISWGLMELAAARKMQSLETASACKVPLQQDQQKRLVDLNQVPRIKWIVTSCFIHAFIAPSAEFLQQACQYGDYTNQPFSYTCVEKGNTVSVQYDAMNYHLWQIIDAWDIAEFEGKSIHEIVDNFVVERKSLLISPSQNRSLPEVLNKQEVIDLQFESCQGPNCQTREASEDQKCHSCQAFLEIESVFAPVPLTVGIYWNLLILAFLLVAIYTRTGKSLPCVKGGKRPISESPSLNC